MGWNKYTGKRYRWTEQALSVMEAVLLCIGADTAFLILHNVPGITFSLPTVLAAGTLTCFTLYAGGKRKRRLICRIAAGITLGICIAGMIMRTALSVQAEALLGSLTGSAADANTDVTLFMIFAALVISILFYLLEIICRMHWLPWLLVTAVMTGSPVFGIRVGIIPMLLGLMFQILFLTVRGAERKGRGMASVFTGTVLAVSVCISVVVTAVWGENLSDFVYQSEGVLSRSLRQISGSAEDPAADGQVSRGNVYRTGETQMTVTLNQEPTEPLYLKGFTGGEYLGGEWEEADEVPLFHEMAQILDWEQWESWISGLYYNLYFSMNTAGNEKTSAQTQRVVLLNYAEGAYSPVYFTPYYGKLLDIRGSGGDDYGYMYYEEKDININWQNVPDDFEMLRDWYRQVQQAYQQVIPDVYTRVPENLVPRLAALCRGRSFQSADEVTAFILSVLRSETSYTMTPGRAPLNKDIVEYFLFDSHEGYCVHFASAAALMYRLCGVPARYASGYRIPQSDFIRQEDGTWEAVVTDESAHAWTEIFLEDYGWVPIDMTPASDGQQHVEYPGLDPAALEEMASSLSADAQTEESRDNGSEEQEASEFQEEDNRETDVWDSFSGDIHYPELLQGVLAVFCELVILAPAIRNGYQLRKRKKEEKMNCRQIFYVMLSVLHRNGILKEYTGNEDDFASKLSDVIPCIRHWEAEKLVNIVKQAAYSKDFPGKEADKFVHGIHFRICRWLKRRN